MNVLLTNEKKIASQARVSEEKERCDMHDAFYENKQQKMHNSMTVPNSLVSQMRES